MSNHSDIPRKVELLIIDDRDYMRVLVNAYLHLAFPDWQIAGATDIEDGLDIVLKYYPRVVLANLHMSNGRAIDIPQRIHPLRPQTDVILMTDERDAGDAALTGMHDGCSFVSMQQIHTHLVPLVERSFRKAD